MSEEMNERDWRLTHELVDRLDPRSTDEVQKIQVYLRTRRDVGACKSLVAAFASNGDRYSKMTADQQERRGMSFIRNSNTASYYQNISRTLNLLFDSNLDPTEQTRVLGWAIRLLRYYRTDEGAAELASQRRASRNAQTDDHNLTPLRTERDQKGIFAPKRTSGLPKRHRPRAAPPPVQSEVTTAAVTLMAPAFGRRAKVQTEQGEEVTCVLLPAYPIAMPGEVCIAELTRENGRLVRAVFKGWKTD
jgi:hypothetical protein